MSRRDPILRLRDMLDHAREALAFTKDTSRADLDADRKLTLSLIRLLEIVGEAARHVPEQVQADHPEIPWPEIVGLRNRLIHNYARVDLAILWRVVSQDLPPLVAALEKIVPPVPPEEDE